MIKKILKQFTDRYHGGRILIIGIALGGIFLTPAAALKRPALQDNSRIQHDVTVTLNLIHVHVMDKDGNPVTDLKVDDFILYDNGKPVKITEFERHRIDLPEVSPAASGEPPEDEEEVNRKFYLFFDFAFNTRQGIEEAKKASLEFLDRIVKPTDQVGILSYSVMKNLTLHETLTRDIDKIRAVINGFGSSDLLGRAENIEQRYWGNISEMAELSGGGISQGDSAGNDTYYELETLYESSKFDRFILKNQIGFFCETLSNLALALAYIPGKKHLIFLSAGIPASILEGNQTEKIQYNNSNILPEGTFGDPFLNKKYNQAAKDLTSANCTIYTLYSQGSSESFDWDYGNPDRKILGINSLQRLADNTGGQYFGNINNAGRIMEEIQKLTGFYYILGYYIPENYDGLYHNIKVRTNRPNCRVNAQRGYYNPKPYRKYSRLERKLHYLDLALSDKPQSDIAFYFPLHCTAFEIGNRQGLFSMAEIPREQMALFHGEEVEISNLIFDKSDNVVDSRAWKVDLSKFPKKDFHYFSLAPLMPGSYRFRVIVRSLKTGTAALSTADAVIPDASRNNIRLETPLLLIPEDNGLYLKGPMFRRPEEEVHLIDLFPYDMTEYVPAVGNIFKSSDRSVTAIVRGHNIGIDLSHRYYDIHFINTENNNDSPIKYRCRYQSLDSEISLFFITFETKLIPPGRYRLDFHIIDSKKNETTTSSVSFQIHE